MGISTTTNRVVYSGDGSSATFSFPYEFTQQSDLKVYLYNSSIGQATLQTLNTNYTVGGTANSQGIYNSGGTIIMNSAAPATLKIVIYRDPSPVQNYGIGQNGTINSTALINALDYMTLVMQRLQDEASRAVRLPEGYAPTFDPTLPMGLAASPSKFLVTNSSANGFVLSDTNGASYIPNTLIAAVSTTQIASIGGAPSGYVMTSQGSSAPGWAPVSLSGSSVSGTLTLGNGGTGGLIPQTWGVVYASSATQLATTDPAPTGMALISNASSAPSFQQLNLALAGSGILPIANGGTGLATYLQYSLIYASASNALGQIASATAGLVLTANGSSAPTWQQAPAGSSALRVVNNLSDLASTTTAFKNLSPMTTWGDIMFAGSGLVVTRLAPGVPGLFLQSNGPVADPSWAAALSNPMTVRGDIIYAGTSAVVSRLAAGSPGQVLTSQGNQADPNWTSVAVTNSVAFATATYNVNTGHAAVFVSSSLFNVNLYGPQGNGGREILIKKTDAANGNVVTITCSSASIDGTSILLATQYEAVLLVSDNTTWNIKQRTIPGPNITYVPTGTWVSNTTYAGRWRRAGGVMKGQVFINVTGAPTAAQLAVNIPSGFLIDLSQFPSGGIIDGQSVGRGITVRSGGYPIGMVEITGSTSFRIGIGLTAGTSQVNASYISNTIPGQYLNGDTIGFDFEVPIVGWQG